jgi:hypothetical protein
VTSDGQIRVGFTQPVLVSENWPELIEKGLVEIYLVSEHHIDPIYGTPNQPRNLDMDILGEFVVEEQARVAELERIAELERYKEKYPELIEDPRVAEQRLEREEDLS